jgi:hypothetical protein
MNKLKLLLNNTKFWQALFTLVLSYMGYSEVTKYTEPQVIQIEPVQAPQEASQPHTHPVHSHKDWQKEIDESRRLHNVNFHGGSS